MGKGSRQIGSVTLGKGMALRIEQQGLCTEHVRRAFATLSFTGFRGDQHVVRVRA